MLDTDKLYELAVDTTEHKKLVMDNCLLMAKYFLDKNDTKMAIAILKRGATHDNSKFDITEFTKLASIMESKHCFKDPESLLTPAETKAIEYHWAHNRHHPEYFENKEDMEEIDIIEMVCDWFARSLQFGTKFIPFVKKRQKNRFHFSDEKFKIILDYCKLIEGLYNTSHKTEEQV